MNKLTDSKSNEDQKDKTKDNLSHFKSDDLHFTYPEQIGLNLIRIFEAALAEHDAAKRGATHE